MKITDDQISFDPSDFDGLSDFAKKAMPAYFGDRVDPDTGLLAVDFVNEFGKQLSVQVQAAKDVLKRAVGEGETVKELVERLAAADQTKLDEADPLLQELLAVLGPPRLAKKNFR